MQFTPLHDRVLVRRVDEDETTAGGLIIPDSAKEKPQEGEVVSCGDGARKDSCELIPMVLNAGDKIPFGKCPGTQAKIDGEDLLLLNYIDFLRLTVFAQAAEASCTA